MKIDLYTLLEKLQSASLKAQDIMFTVENSSNSKYWVQLTRGNINAYYPYAENPESKLKDIDIKLIPSIAIIDWNANSYITFEYSNKDLRKVEAFVRRYLEIVMNFKQSFDDWQLTEEVEEVEEAETDAEDVWSITAGDWNGSFNKWNVQPVLIVNGIEYTYPTPVGYIDRMRSAGLSGAESVITGYQNIIDYWEQRKSEENSRITSTWAMTGWEWSNARHKWKKQPVLTINGENFTFDTRIEYINKMQASGYSDANLLNSIAKLQSSVDENPEILKKTIFSKGIISLVVLMLSASAIFWIVLIFNINPESLKDILPSDCVKSNFFWLMLVIGTIYSIFNGGFTEYKPLVKSGGKTYESYDMTDQVGAGLMTFLSPVFTGAVIALVPYYLLYWLMGVLSRTNVFILSAIVVGIAALVILGFVMSRPKYKRIKEVFWLIIWGAISILIFRISLGVMLGYF